MHHATCVASAPVATRSHVTARAGARLGMLLLAGMLLAATGCHASHDRQVVRSTPHEPTNVTVIDTADGRTLWRMQIPANHEVELDFSHPRDQRRRRLAELSATRMNWELRGLGDTRIDRSVVTGPTSGRLDLPGNPVRMHVDLRATAAVTEVGPIQPGQ